MRKGHPGNLHLWWNRSPIAASTALLYAALTDAAEADPERKVQLQVLNGLARNDPACLAQAQQELNRQQTPLVADSFSGFGGLPLAAEQLGLQADASDLNAVAVLLTKAAAEIPSRFAGLPPVSRSAAPGTNGLAADIRHYGSWMLQKAQEKLAHLYPPEHDTQPYAWLWVRTVECPNPACKCRMPLASSFVLSKRESNAYWAEPIPKDGAVTFVIRKGNCPADKVSNKVGGAGAKFQCPACGEIATDAYIKKAGRERGLGLQLMAVVCTAQEQKQYYAPDANQIAAADVPLPVDIPTGAISTNAHWFSPPGFGLTEYTDLFTARQLQMLTTLCDLIPQVVDKVACEALAVGMSDTGGPLAEGGSGALAYGQAVGTYLALAVSKMANYHSSICTWNNQSEIARAAITRQAIPMTWTFAERSPFTTATGGFTSILEAVADAVDALPMQKAAEVTQQDAICRKYPAGAVLFTELPYYDNVGYADLSDYFYIWLRRCLKPVYPALFEKIVTSKEELSSVPGQSGLDAAQAQAAYQTKLAELLQNFAQAASTQYPSVLFFQYSKADEKSLFGTGDTNGTCRFAQLIQCIADAGFAVTAAFPLRAEQPNDRLESYRVAVVFRKNADGPFTTRRALASALSREMPALLQDLLTEEIDPSDRAVTALGMGLSIATRYSKILNADGTKMSMQDALQLAAQEISKFFAATEENSEEN